MNNLKQIAIALHGYHEAHCGLPPAEHRDKNGKPLLSWRVLLLPYLERQELFKQFHMDEPWDSPHNLQLLPEMPMVFAPTGAVEAPPHSTFLQVFVGKGTAFEQGGFVMPDDFPDGTANTLVVVEAGIPVPWTKPADLPYDKDQPLPELGGVFKRQIGFSIKPARIHGLHTLLADGSVRFFPGEPEEPRLRALITRNGNEGPQLYYD